MRQPILLMISEIQNGETIVMEINLSQYKLMKHVRKSALLVQILQEARINLQNVDMISVMKIKLKL